MSLARTYAAYGLWHVTTIMLHLFMANKKTAAPSSNESVIKARRERTKWSGIGTPAAQDNHLVRTSLITVRIAQHECGYAWAKASLITSRYNYSFRPRALFGKK